MIKIGLSINFKNMKNDNQVVTRKILREEFGGFEKRIDKKMDEKLGNLEKRMDEKLDDLAVRFYEYAASKEDLRKAEERIMEKMATKEDLNNMFDIIVTRLDNLQTESAAHTSAYLRLEQRLEAGGL